jgi:hypothetical protein
MYVFICGGVIGASIALVPSRRGVKAIIIERIGLDARSRRERLGCQP